MKPQVVISSMSNSQIKNLMLLLKKSKARNDQGIFVVEGIKMFEEAKTAGLVLKAYASESFYNEIVSTDPDYFEGLNYELVTDSVFKVVSETKTPQGIMGTVKTSEYSLDNLLEDPRALLLILEDIRDPGNLGTMIRTAEGAGVTGILLSNTCVDIYNPKVIRSTMGSIFRVPFYYTENFYEDLNKLRERSIHIYAAHLAGKNYDSEGNFLDRSGILIGNEANGLTQRASDLADQLIKIPMSGKVESLNAAIAAAILMYEASRQRRNQVKLD